MIGDRPEPLLGKFAGKVTAPGRTILLTSALLFVLGSISLVYSRGKTVIVTTNTDNAQVNIDGRPGSAISPTMWRFDRVPFGQRQAFAAHRDFLAASNALDIGLFGDGQFELQMERRKVSLTINTVPGAEVFLNGQSFGSANPSGVFTNNQIPAGDYELAMRLAGYEDWRNQIGLHDDERSFRVSLQMTPEKREEMLRQRGRAYELMLEANTLFGGRNYRAALASIDESIRLNPEDFRAIQLRDRIVETMNILQQ